MLHMSSAKKKAPESHQLTPFRRKGHFVDNFLPTVSVQFLICICYAYFLLQMDISSKIKYFLYVSLFSHNIYLVGHLN